MSEFSKYAQQAHDIAKEIFAEYQKADAALKSAEQARRTYPVPRGMATAEAAAKAARAQADYLEAEAAMKAARERFSGGRSNLMGIRNQLVNALDARYSANPDAMDANTIELLKSGIMKPAEYARLMQKAQDEGNTTMMRIIGKYAADAAEAEESQHGYNSQTAQALRAVSYNALDNPQDATLGKFDLFVEVFDRCADNPFMIDAWDELTGNALESF